MRLLILLCLVTVAVAAPRKVKYYSGEPQLLRYENNNDGLGTYNYAYEQTDGQQQEQQGELKNAGRDDESLVVRGSYTWVAPNGVAYIVTYIADENGFQPEIEEGEGDEQPPGVSPALAASLIG